MTELIVVRHGETAWNAEGRIQGHRPVPLNKRGLQQAAATANRLSNEPFDALYSSDLKRTIQTARAIAEITGHRIIPDIRLREWKLGILEGLTETEANARYPQAYLTNGMENPSYTILGGESIWQRHHRSTTCAEELATLHPGKRIVIVTHGGILDDFYRRAKNIPLDAPRNFKLYNASLNIFQIQKIAWTLTQWGEITHLQNIGSMGSW